jgi:hypothetical protein
VHALDRSPDIRLVGGENCLRRRFELVKDPPGLCVAPRRVRKFGRNGFAGESRARGPRHFGRNFAERRTMKNDSSGCVSVCRRFLSAPGYAMEARARRSRAAGFSAEQVRSSSRPKPVGGSRLPLETSRRRVERAVASVTAATRSASHASRESGAFSLQMRRDRIYEPYAGLFGFDERSCARRRPKRRTKTSTDGWQRSSCFVSSGAKRDLPSRAA